MFSVFFLISEEVFHTRKIQITVAFTFSKFNFCGKMGAAESVVFDPLENKYVNEKLGLHRLYPSDNS